MSATSTTTERETLARAMREAADLIASLPPEIPAPNITTAYGHRTTVDVAWYLMNGSEDQRADLAKIVRYVGGPWDKVGLDDTFRLSQTRGLLELNIGATREEVCSRRVVGSREVTRTIPAAPAVEEHVVTETIEDVEWDCEPIMAARESVSA